MLYERGGKKGKKKKMKKLITNHKAEKVKAFIKTKRMYKI